MSPEVENRLQQYLDVGMYEKIAPLLDLAELESPEVTPLMKWPVAVHLLAHVYNSDLVNARFLWKRLPEAFEKSEEILAAWHIVQLFWNQRFDQYSAALETPEWSPGASSLAHAIAKKAKKEMLDLVSATYAVLSVDHLTSLLGCSTEDTLTYVEERSWKLHEGKVEVTKLENEEPQILQEGQLQKLAEILTHLES